MRNFILFCTKRIGDVITSNVIAGAIKNQNPKNKTTIVLFEESKKAAINSPFWDDIVVLERKNILSTKKMACVSESKSLNAFFENIESIISKKWDVAINFSNDLLSANIIGELLSNNPSLDIHGTYIGERLEVKCSNIWIKLLNEHSTIGPYALFNHLDIFLNSLKLNNYCKYSKENLLTDDHYNNECFTKLNLIREAEKGHERKAQLVGIQMFSSTPDKNIPSSLVSELVEEILDNPNYYPILLNGPFENERKIINDINASFNQYLVTIEADLLALPSVLNNLDAIITADTFIKHMADSINIPCVEIATSEKFLYKHSTRNLKSLILKTYPEKLSANTIIKTLDKVFAKNITYSNSKELDLMYCSQDEYGIYYSGESNDFKCAKIYLSRTYFISAYIDNKYKVLKSIHFDSSLISSWILEQKEELSSIGKCILKTFRGLKSSKDNKAHKDLIVGIDEILCFGNQDGLCSIPVSFFKYGIEGLSKKDAAHNTIKLEELILELKNKVQLAYNFVKTTEEEFLVTNNNFGRPKSDIIV